MYKQKLIDEFPDYAKWIKMIPPTPEEILSKLESMNRDDCSEYEWPGIVYRIGELHYQLGHKRKARQIFLDFVKKCEIDEVFMKYDLCDNAKEFLELLKKIYFGSIWYFEYSVLIQKLFSKNHLYFDQV